MDILGNGGGLKSILGTSGGGGGGGGGGTVLKGAKTVFTFNANSTDIKNDFNVVDGEIVLKDPEQGDIRFTNGNDTNTRGTISYNDESANIHYEVDEFKLTSAQNAEMLIGDKQGRIGIHKPPDPSFNVDISGSLNITGGGSIYQEGYDILFNLGKLFDYLTKPPPAFDFNTDISDNYSGYVSIQRTSFNIVLNWIKGDNYETTYNFGLEQKTLPYVDKIGVEIIDVLDGTGTLKDWVKVVSNDIAGNATSYTFAIDSTYTDNQGNTFVADKDSSFNIRIYPINASVLAGGTPNYLVFENLTFVGPSPPTAPLNLSISLVSGNEQKSFQLSFVKPEFNDREVGRLQNIPDDPSLEKYKIVYQPRTTDCRRFPQVLDTSSIELIRNGTNQTTTYTVTDDGTTDVERVYPATTYDVSLSAKNTQADNYGDVSHTSITTQLPKATDFRNVQPTSITWGGSHNTITQFRVQSANNTNEKYFNINSNQLTTTNVTNTVFVNYTKLGVDSSGEMGLASVDVYHKVGSGAEEVDASLVFHGYQDNTFDNGYNGTYDVSNTSQIEFSNISNTDANVYDASRPEYYGFGLIGEYKLTVSNLVGQGGDGSPLKFVPSTDRYTIGYRVSGANINKSGWNEATHEISFYVDDLSLTPQISSIQDRLSNATHLYSYGVPSIKTIQYDISWNTSRNGRYVLPTNGLISKIVLNGTSTMNVIGGASSSQEYTTTTTPKEQTFSHTHQRTLAFKTYHSNNIINSLYKIYSYNVLHNGDVNGTSEFQAFSSGSNDIELYCDYGSFDVNGGSINTIKTFGRDNIYTYNSSTEYTLTEFNTSDRTQIQDNQLIYFDGKFVNPQYLNHPYRNFTVYPDISVGYSLKSVSGDNGVKWLVKKFANITVNGSSQLRKLKITDHTGTTYNYNNYNGRLYILQFYSGSTEDAERVTGWLNPNQDFDSTNTNFKQDRGVRNGSDPTEFYLYAEEGRTFDIYVRIGLENSNTTQTYISGLSLE